VRAGLDSDVSFQSAQRLGSLAVSDDAVARLAAPTVAARTLATQSLWLSGNGSLDIADGALAIDYDAGAASPAGQVRGWVAAARNGGAWNRAGLTSSEAALRPDARAIGFGEASALLGLSGARTAVWRGQVVDASTLLVRTALPGDATLDDAVNFGDLLALAKSYNGANAYWAQGDFDYNGVVNFADLLILAKHYNQTTAGAPVVPGASAEFNAGVAAAFAAAAVPEPTTLGVLAIGGTGLLVRRRRRGD
jgi:hypothetical protein